GAGLRKREVMRAEFYFRILAEHLPGKLSQSSLQIRESNVLIDNQSLYLMERRRMGGIYFIGTEHTAGRNHADGKLSLLHDTGLNRRSLGPKHDIFRNVEGVLLILSRMVCRNI